VESGKENAGSDMLSTALCCGLDGPSSDVSYTDLTLPVYSADPLYRRAPVLCVC